MAFNISSFSSSLQKHGVAKNNTFRMRITTPLALQAEVQSIAPVANDIEFYCQSVTLPEFDIQTSEIQPQAFGPIVRRPNNMNFAVLPAIFRVDQDLEMVKYFHRWTQHILNFDNSNGYYSSVDGALPFEMNYKQEYATSMMGDVLGPTGAVEYSYTFGGAYPVNVGSIEEAWADNDQIMTLSVGFTYDTLSLTGSKGGFVTDVGTGSTVRAPTPSPFNSNTSIDQITSASANRLAEAGSVKNLINRGIKNTKYFK